MTSLTEQYLDSVQAKLVGLDAQLPALAAAASVAGERACVGGKVWALSDEAGFVSELQHRASGLMMVRGLPGGGALPLDQAISEGDAVLAATQNHDPVGQGACLEALAKRGVHVTLIGSADSSLRSSATAFVDNGLPPGTGPVLTFRGRSVCPAASAINVAAGWLWALELANACHRLGKAPVFLVSGVLRAGFDRNQQHEGKSFHGPGEYQVSAAPAGEKGRELLAELLRCFSSIRATEIGKLAELGAIAATTIAAGNTVWCASIGHNLAAQRDLDGDPGLFHLVFPEQRETPELSDGDLYIYNGYYFFPKEELSAVRAAGIRSAWVMGGKEIETIYPHPGEIHINAYWRYGDAAIHLPGYDVRVIPPSGVVTTAMLWLLNAAAADAMED